MIARIRALPPAVQLAIPFLLTVIALRGMTERLLTFHWEDEPVYQVKVIQQFIDGLPFPGLVSYDADQTPLFHYLFALIGSVTGTAPDDLWFLRLINVAFAYGAALVLRRIFARRFSDGWATVLTIVFLLAPYTFGSFFILVTDPLAMLFAFLAFDRIDRLQRGDDDDRLRTALIACGWLGVCLLTRQSYVWMSPILFFVIWRADLPQRARVIATAALGAVHIPLLALFIAWGGTVPKTADVVKPADLAEALRSPVFTLATFALYGSLFFGPRVLQLARDERVRRWLAGPAVIGIATAVVLLLAAATLDKGIDDEGFIWQIADKTPELLGSPALWWPMTAIGAAVLAAMIKRDGIWTLGNQVAIWFLASSIGYGILYQKYTEPPVFLALLLALRQEDLERPALRAGLGLSVLVGIAYVVRALV